MFRSASLFIGTSFTVAVFTIFATPNVDSIVGILHKIYSMQRILIHIKSQSLCQMCPSAPMVCSEPGGQKPVLSLSLDLINSRGPFYQYGLTSNPPWISNYIHYEKWNEITYPIPNFNGCTVEVWDWISNFTPHLTRHVITYRCWN